MIFTGASTFLPLTLISVTDWSAYPSCAAVAGLMMAALSQVNFVTGLGSSCNHPLLMKRPSKIVGSGRKTISSASLFAAVAAAVGLAATDFGAVAESAMKPSCSDFFHQAVKSAA